MSYKPINECTTVYELLEDPNRWTKGFYAKDEDGNNVYAHEQSARCFCLSGAIKKIYYDHNDKSMYLRKMNDLGDALPKLFPGIYNYVEWQDRPERSHAEVLELVKYAGI